MKFLRRLLYIALALVLLVAAGFAALFFVVFAPVSTVGKLEHPRCGTTRTRTARPRSTSTVAWPACSPSTTPTARS